VSHSDGAGAGRAEEGLARTIQRRPYAPATSPAGGEVEADVEQAVTSARSGGTPLAGAVRRRMEDAFEADFSGVRLHSGPPASKLNEHFGAKAFTIGSDIFLRDGLPDTTSADGQRLLAHELTHTVQQGASAPRAARLVQRQPDESAATEGQGESEAETEEGPSAEGEELPEVEGMLPPTQEEELVRSGPPPGTEADRDPSRPSGPAPVSGGRRAPDSPTASTGRHRVTVGGVNVVDSETESSALVAQGLEDKVTASATVTSSTNPGLTVTPFGAMGPSLAFENQTYKVKTPKKKGGEGTVNVQFTIKWDLKWGTTNGGRTDIPSASDPAVTADTYQKIVSDLTPVKKEKSWVATRTTYWSEKTCARHEKFHARDARDWMSSEGKKFVVNYLKKKTVTLTEDERKDVNQVKTKMQSTIADAKSALIQAYTTYMNGTGLTYYSYPSEEKAFGDGKQPYLDLASAVKKRGKRLADEKQKQEKKAAKTTAPTT
jgi:hypothetical protein